ncbi:LysR family transcriptional regulator [Telmatospirillum siberiense]|uniref:LysR family transcriptional regulator n=1 Tax=Telmatospirillum siberiense TaxID=382514 RepID=A0A2N3Q081_9PROT|nr:LysR family transcriptional regulator [Telmatospirillum siberiense]PKU26067.1 LysR family transcriptional regulator [Telmatospirillum siberiense]
MNGLAMFDPVLLSTFVEVARAGSFSEAGRRLGLSQSTVSEQVRRLERLAERRLFVRDTHRVALTADGDAMVRFARTILDVNEHARRYFAGSAKRQRLRLGASENFVRSRLPSVLHDFLSRTSDVDLELTVGLSDSLFDLLDAGELDMVLGKRRPGEARGQLIRRERMVWIGTHGTVVRPETPIPLVMYPPPSMSRAMAIEALEKAGLAWRIVCTCDGLMGLQAATLGGFGVMVQPQSMIPAGLIELPPSPMLPDLGDVEFVVASATRHPRGATAELTEVLLRH